MPIDKQRLKECYSYSADNFTSQHIFVPIGNFFAKIFIRTPITPNQLTAGWGLLLILCSVAMAFGNYWVCILAGIGWVIGYSLDYTDGTIARYKNLRSKKGPFIDMVNHRISYFLLFFCAGLGAWNFGRTEYFGLYFNPDIYLVLGGLAGICMVLIMDFGAVFRDACGLEEIHDGDGAVNVEGRYVKNKNLFNRINDFNPLVFTNMMFLIPIFAILGLMDVFVIFYGIFYPLATIFRYFSYFRIIDDLSSKKE